MRIAILGATSQIAKDTILSLGRGARHELALFARRPEAVSAWLAQSGLSGRHAVAGFDAFTHDRKFEALLNFVGVGNPAATAAMGASILDITTLYDDLALGYVQKHPHCRYVFLSSGAAYGANFDQPVDELSEARVPINALKAQDWYSVAKMYAECRHRARAGLPIVDLRVFNYFSHTQDLSARFLITDIVRAIQSKETLLTNRLNIMRDFIGPADFNDLVERVLHAAACNDVFDCYTQAPLDKFTLLESMRERFGLRYTVDEVTVPNATGAKPNYYSRNRRAERLGYQPAKTSLQTVLDETALCL